MYPLVTIITPSFNQGIYLEETIKSVINQTYSNIQYIVVDGLSTDNSIEVINKYKDYIDIILIECDSGQSDAINKGFNLARGKLIGWLNSDDIIYPNCVEAIVELYLQNKTGAIFYPSNLDIIDSKGLLTKKSTVEIKNIYYLLNNDYKIIQQGSFYTIDCLMKAGFLDQKLNYCMDLDLWLRLLNYGPIHYIDSKIISAFRIWGNTKTTNGKELFLREIRLVLLRHKANYFSKNILRTYYFEIKCLLKKLFLK